MILPDDTQRLAIVGRTGSGKTVGALWHLSRRGFNDMPWIIIDYKGDTHIARIPGLREISVRAKPPTRPGLYVIRPMPDIDDEALDLFLCRVWENGRTGIYLDEGYMIGRYNKWYRALLTQGRSKHIPIITLSQAPAWVSPFIFRESEFIQAFHLQTPADRIRMAEFMPGADVSHMPKHHSWYWNVLDFELTYLRPVPPPDEILDRIESRLGKLRALG